MEQWSFQDSLVAKPGGESGGKWGRIQLCILAYVKQGHYPQQRFTRPVSISRWKNTSWSNRLNGKVSVGNPPPLLVQGNLGHAEN